MSKRWWKVNYYEIRKSKLKHEYEKIHNFKLENEARKNIEKKAEKIVDYQLA